VASRVAPAVRSSIIRVLRFNRRGNEETRPQMRRSTGYWLMALTLAGFGLRAYGIFHNTFHPDEALYASWAREIAVWRDPLLSRQLVDKPPLLFYLQAGLYPLLGPVETAARLPSLFASVCLIPIAAKWSWQIYRSEEVALASAALVSLSPLAVALSATAFIDPLLTVLLAASFWAMAAAGRGERAYMSPRYALNSGLLFGLAAASKHQTWLFLPVALSMGVLMRWARPLWRRWFLALISVLLALVFWDAASTGKLSLWASQMAAYGGVRLAWSWELGPRLNAWLALWRYVLPWPIFVLFLVLCLLSARYRTSRDNNLRHRAWDLLLVTSVLGFSVFHWLVAIPAWERYLLPAFPLAFLLVARLASGVFEFSRGTLPPLRPEPRFRPANPWLAAAVLGGVLLPWALLARSGALGLGGYPSADNGAGVIAEALRDEPYGTVLYDHWYSWQWRYHLFGSTVYVSWFESPAMLAQDLAVFGDSGQPRFLVLPAGPESLPVLRTVRQAGFAVVEAATARDEVGLPTLILYRLQRL
jgi:4-amino-4-deoxy-L-arabinose transferase-like glycosyltransferase